MSYQLDAVEDNLHRLRRFVESGDPNDTSTEILLYNLTLSIHQLGQSVRRDLEKIQRRLDQLERRQ